MVKNLRYGGVLAAAALCYAALGTVLPILPPLLAGPLHGGAVEVGLAVGAPALTAVVARPAGGRIADRWGPRRPVIGGAILMALATAPMVLGPVNLGERALVVSRLAVGVGEGVMMAAAVLWLLRLAGPERRGQALGHIGLANYVGLTVGPLLAAPLGGAGHSDRVFAVAAVLPLLGLGAAALLPGREGSPTRGGEAGGRASLLEVLSAVLLPGLGLALVNVGYVALISFGATSARAHGVGGGEVIVPVFGATVIAARTVAAWVPDRVGAMTTLVASVLVEAGGLVGVASAGSEPALLAATAVLGAGQALAVPALGLLALRHVPPARHGAASGAFFAFFDLGVGLGGPATGLAASLLGSPAGALWAAAPAVASVALLSFTGRRSRPPS